jgi:hypothetical protein
MTKAESEQWLSEVLYRARQYSHTAHCVANSGAREQNWAVLSGSTQHIPKLLVAHLLKKFLSKSEGHYHTHNSQHVDRILSHINTVLFLYGFS